MSIFGEVITSRHHTLVAEHYSGCLCSLKGKAFIRDVELCGSVNTVDAIVGSPFHGQYVCWQLLLKQGIFIHAFMFVYTCFRFFNFQCMKSDWGLWTSQMQMLNGGTSLTWTRQRSVWCSVKADLDLSQGGIPHTTWHWTLIMTINYFLVCCCCLLIVSSM